jgi:hypothetical protein
MRGDAFLSVGDSSPAQGGSNMENANVQAPTTDVTADGNSNLAANTAGAKYSVWWLMLIGVVYFIWGYIQNKKIGESLKPANIEANFHNIIVVSLSAIIGINVLNVVLTKLAAMRIPFLSRLAGSFLPLVSL